MKTRPASHGESCTKLSNESYSRSVPSPWTVTCLRPFSTRMPWRSIVMSVPVRGSLASSASASVSAADLAPSAAASAVLDGDFGVAGLPAALASPAFGAAALALGPGIGGLRVGRLRELNLFLRSRRRAPASNAGTATPPSRRRARSQARGAGCRRKYGVHGVSLGFHAPLMRRKPGLDSVVAPPQHSDRRPWARAAVSTRPHATIDDDFSDPRDLASATTGDRRRPRRPSPASRHRRAPAGTRTGPVSRIRWFVFGLVFAVLAAAAPARPALAQDADTVTLNFVNADIEAVVKAVAEITGRNFVVDPKVKGTINIVSARPVPKSLVYPTLLSALRLQGFTAVEGDGVVKIVPEADAKLQGGPVGRGPVGGGGDRLVTQVITLNNESAAQLVNVLRPLISPNNTIAAFPAANALVITDYADNLRRIERIVASLDRPPASEPTLVPLKNASALDVVAMRQPLVRRKLRGDAGRAGHAAARDAGRRSALEQRADPLRQPGARPRASVADRAARHAGARRRQHVHRLPEERRGGAHRRDAARAVRRRQRRRRPCAAPALAAALPMLRPARRRVATASAAATTPLSTTASSPASSATRAGGPRDDPGRHRQQRADHHGARARLQQPARDHREARHAPRAGLSSRR